MSANTRRTKPTFLYVTISIAIVLFMVGVYLMTFFHAKNISNIIKERIKVIVELQDNVTPESRDKVTRIIDIQEGVKPGSVHFVSKEDGLKFMKLTQHVLLEEEQNPFKDILTFNILADYYTEANIDKIKKRLSQESSVHSVFHENETIGDVKSNLNKVSYVILIVGLIFMLLAFTIIYNTLNLSLYADRMEIKTMELVGARWSFIKRPYIKGSSALGVRAWLLSVFLLLSVVVIVRQNVNEVYRLLEWKYIFITLFIMLVISQLITITITERVVHKYLRQNIDVLYD